MKAIQEAIEKEVARTQDAMRTISKQGRRCRETQFQLDEDQKSLVRLQDLISKLQDKLKVQKAQFEESVSLVFFSCDCSLKNFNDYII